MAGLGMQRLLCLLAVVAAAAAAVPGPNGKPDPVNDLIASLVDGAKGAPASAPLSHSVTVALDNANQVNKEGPDSNDQKRAEMSREAATKKGYENTQKADTEQTHKIRSEARQKKMDLEIRISKAEAKNKEFDANMQLKEEQRSKKAAEEQRKTQEGERKDIERSNANAAAARRQVERSFELQKATAAAAEATLKAKQRSAQQMAQEGVQKEEAKAARKRERDAQLFRKEVADKKVAEKAEKHRQAIIAKKKAEEAGKQETRMREEKAKQLTAQAEQEAKKRKREATGKWCECSNQRVHFDRNNAWQSCPSDSLLVGMYRGAFHNMANIYYYRCCKPCREHGTQPLTVSGCMTANWVTSFDSQGWSMCPANHFIQGLYKSSCNWIYCLEYARCCKLSESRGSSDCKPQQKWATSFDAAGWSVVNDNRFIQGFYRSGGHFLYNIEYPQQCKYFAHNPSA